ncbi:hypothetical protein BT69DRAFT_1345982 [Atractiella rhizophila]|nr:hypothetical protein BT69DRAFT_1345982 [Atractiella rhizophila]
MSGFLEKARNLEFTGALPPSAPLKEGKRRADQGWNGNRAFGKGKHSAVPLSGDEDRGVRGGPQASVSRSATTVGRGWEDDDLSRRMLALRFALIFFPLIAFAIYLACATFQTSHGLSTSFGIGLSIFLAAEALAHGIVMITVPFIYQRWDKLKGFARALRQIRVGFIVNGTQTGLMLIGSLLTTISAYTAGCKNYKKDPHAGKEGYIDDLPDFCLNKRAGAAFFWFSFLAWSLSFYLVFRTWFQTRKLGPKIPGFKAPASHTGHPIDDTSTFDHRDSEEYNYGSGGDGGRTGGYSSGGIYGDYPQSDGYGHQPISYQPPPMSQHDFAQRAQSPRSPQQSDDPYEGIRHSLQLDQHSNSGSATNLPQAGSAPQLPRPPVLPPLYSDGP